jgi:hypothetical protein
MGKPINPVKNNQECEKMISGSFQGVLSMADDNEPYAVPINHAYWNGKFYFHCAVSGKKTDIINKNPNVCYVINKYFGEPQNLAKGLKCHGCWESVLAYGKARVITEKEELVAAFKAFMKYYGNDDYQVKAESLATTRIIVIEVDKMTARREHADRKVEYWYWEK